MTKMKFFVDEHLYEFEVTRDGETIEVTIGDRHFLVDLEKRGARYDVFVETEYYEVHPHIMVGSMAMVSIDGVRKEIQLVDSKATPAQLKARRRKGETLSAPMPGKVLAVHVEEGDLVKAGTLLLTLEAMKMENELAASVGGVVDSISVSPGDSVTGGQELLRTR